MVSSVEGTTPAAVLAGGLGSTNPLYGLTYANVDQLEAAAQKAAAPTMIVLYVVLGLLVALILGGLAFLVLRRKSGAEYAPRATY
jgi:hypothetical protein